MKDKPLQKITVRDITRQAMVNRSTFYAHFKDKYDLFSTAIGQRVKQDVDAALGNSTGFTRTNLRTLLLVVAGDLLVKIPNECKPTSVNELIPLTMIEMQNIIYEIVLGWVSDINISDTERKALTVFTTGAIFGAVVHWGQHLGSEPNAEQLADRMMPYLVGGVGNFTDVVSGIEEDL